jgi:hypothetical protein
MAYRVEVGPRADAQLADLDAKIGASIERKILWLAENASVVVHRRLAGMPEVFTRTWFKTVMLPPIVRTRNISR